MGLKRLNLQYISDDTGEKTGIVLPIGEFRELLEDLEDLAIMAERREEPTISHEELLATIAVRGDQSSSERSRIQS